MIVKINMPKGKDGIDILERHIITTHGRIVRNYIDELEITEDNKEILCKKLRDNKNTEM
ncbi:hypothetical protein [Anaeromicrobium sediminis]|uniref:hypothetical protein n=1 Tax=Anaeromicrobium sediminis TaxID=1478221 RepID=UPI001594E918|nr:hypothetical protein [Anaeromicrobium sediminis]